MILLFQILLSPLNYLPSLKSFTPYQPHSKIHNQTANMVEFTVYKGSADRKIVESKTTKEVKSDEVLIKVTHSGVCGTDEHYKGADMVLGHEGAGVVEVRQKRNPFQSHLLTVIRKSDPQLLISRREILLDGDINTLLAVTASSATPAMRLSALDEKCMDLRTSTKVHSRPTQSGRQTTSSRSQTPFHASSLPLFNVEEQPSSTS